MKISTVKLVFKGNDTVNELYEMTIKEVKDVVLMVDGNTDKLHKIRLELKEMLAIIENKQAKKHGQLLKMEN